MKGAAALLGRLGEFKTLLPLFVPHKGRYAAGLSCLILVDAAQIFIPQWTRHAINRVQRGGFSLGEITALCAAMVGTMAFVCLGRFFWRYFLHGASRRIEAQLRELFFAHLLTMDSGFYEKFKSGDLMARSTNDIGAIRMAIGWGIVAGIDGTVMAAGILIVIFIQSPAIAAFAVLPVPFITLFIIIFGKAVGRRFKRAQEAYSAMSEVVRESFAGLRVIKSFVREDTFIGKTRAANREYVRANMSVARVYGLFFPLILFFSGLTSLIVLIAGGRAAARGELPVGDLVSLIAYIQMLVWPMFGAGFTVNMIQRGAVSMARVNEALSARPSIRDCDEGVGGEGEGGGSPPRSRAASRLFRCPPSGGSAPATPPLIRLAGLSFSYPNGTAALHDISLELAAGECLGIFGRTGCGKSTLVKLLPRLLDAPPGTVFIEGRDVREWPLAGLRALFGVAPQESFLFSQTIAHNIAYGSAAPLSEEETAELVRLAALEKDIAGFSAGLETAVGERGLTLSGGQKQRLTVARAAAHDPPILILDDSLSACDAETERVILRNLEALRQGKTTIIVSHRVSAFRFAARVAVLEEGRLAEYGPPAALAAATGYYAKSAQIQSRS